MMDLINKFRIYSILLVISTAVWIAWSAVNHPPVNMNRTIFPKEGLLAPDFALKNEEGIIYQLNDFNDRPVMLLFWASWCPHCKVELPVLQRVYDEYQDKGVAVLAVNTTQQDDLDSARQFVKGNGLTYPVLYDIDGSISKLYLVRALPTTYFINTDGVINRLIIGGPISEALLRTQLINLLDGGG